MIQVVISDTQKVDLKSADAIEFMARDGDGEDTITFDYTVRTKISRVLVHRVPFSVEQLVMDRASYIATRTFAHLKECGGPNWLQAEVLRRSYLQSELDYYNLGKSWKHIQ